MMKKFAKACVVTILGWQVRRLRKKHDFKVVGVVGSIGKTSTKFAVARVLQQKLRVRFQEGNYNDIVTVPLIFFGQPEPSLFNPLAWLITFIKNEQQIANTPDFDVVVVEVGTDGPGQIAAFARYLRLDMTVVTALTPEHMEFFADLAAVAREELSVASYSQELIVNGDLCSADYLNVPVPVTMFSSRSGDYQILDEQFVDGVAEFSIRRNAQPWLQINMDAVAKSELYSATAAAVVADKLGLTAAQIKKGVAGLEPISGRMQRLKGVKESIILDETYNASPDAVKAALDSLYMMKAPQKIAILGNMNELGVYSKDAHIDIGNYCDAKQLAMVVTIGPEANKYLAPAAMEQGCLVKTFDDPYAAGEFVKSEVQKGAVILAKGSQNNVYAEEAVKPLLANSADFNKLVRQSTAWMKVKDKNFKR
jgi:UDP-N-acetylmuramoyl-tripeptide--D-alanyl-D-alanine ligase